MCSSNVVIKTKAQLSLAKENKSDGFRLSANHSSSKGIEERKREETPRQDPFQTMKRERERKSRDDLADSTAIRSERR